ncbi:hypothetical protein IB275_30305 [Pseudomonas sp. PDM21]|uniref:hypothetical protein n=1 Tax=Pseudomonas sp. PDM21 TaxID=2769257 RepID=UPI00177B592F|nr:hypothetical protein [Pseudomonas sp. PDM21]MBD9674908.1 hypothetical protein [Pseudomonas sp. PDM21]
MQTSKTALMPSPRRFMALVGASSLLSPAVMAPIVLVRDALSVSSHSLAVTFGVVGLCAIWAAGALASRILED